MANVSLSDVRDAINVSISDVPDVKLQKMIKRAQVTLSLELGRETDTDRHHQAPRVLFYERLPTGRREENL